MKKVQEFPSVHLEQFPEYSTIPFDYGLVKQMRIVRCICNAGLAVRHANNIRVRMPLSSITIYCKKDFFLDDYKDIIAEELNVKNVIFSKDFDSFTNERIVVNLKSCGIKFGKEISKIVNAVNNGQWSYNHDGTISVMSHILNSSDFEVSFEVNDPKIQHRYSSVSLGSEFGLSDSMFVILDTNFTPELIQDGIIRDMIRLIQQDRKSLNMVVSDVAKIKVISSSIEIVSVLSVPEMSGYLLDQSMSDPDFFYNTSDLLPVHMFSHSLERVGDFDVFFF